MSFLQEGNTSLNYSCHDFLSNAIDTRTQFWIRREWLWSLPSNLYFHWEYLKVTVEVKRQSEFSNDRRQEQKLYPGMGQDELINGRSQNSENRKVTLG